MFGALFKRKSISSKKTSTPADSSIFQQSEYVKNTDDKSVNPDFFSNKSIDLEEDIETDPPKKVTGEQFANLVYKYGYGPSAVPKLPSAFDEPAKGPSSSKETKTPKSKIFKIPKLSKASESSKSPKTSKISEASEQPPTPKTIPKTTQTTADLMYKYGGGSGSVMVPVIRDPNSNKVGPSKRSSRGN